ncbi:MAG: cytidylate kinase-like family protein [Clostridiales bacterium]|jgi:cytidylate kinase|nr:cytidylate kinase-like family protein [Clostridiales bacterium]
MKDHYIITVGREFGSGGRAVGKLLAAQLGINYYDKDVLAEIAEERGFDPSAFKDYTEVPRGNLLFNIATGEAPGALEGQREFDKIFQVQSEIIQRVASEGSCVIVGRCADYILRGAVNLVSVFVHADYETRKQRLMTLHDIASEDVMGVITRSDEQRAAYYAYCTNSDWHGLKNYDLSLDCGNISVDDLARVILEFVRLKFMP